jgi:ribosomal protein S18 acetylase RimI-like enzyme
VVEERGRVVGYAYASIEGRDWNLLLDKHGAIHDILIASKARRSGIGKVLMTAMVDALVEKGAKRIILSTMVQNTPAQRLFAAVGFRPTMIEMTFNPSAATGL